MGADPAGLVSAKKMSKFSVRPSRYAKFEMISAQDLKERKAFAKIVLAFLGLLSFTYGGNDC